MMKKIGLVLSFFLLLSACTDRDAVAPVVELKWQPFNPHAKQYIVVRGDTLYSIAFRYDLDYQQVALMNHLQKPYRLHIGQKIYFGSLSLHRKIIKSVASSKSKAPLKPSRPSRPTRVEPVQFAGQGWSWPARGRVIARFSPLTGMKGIDIAGNKGDKVYAASSGVVAYSGSGLGGYGNLIIIKHGNQLLTAYGHNARNVVQVGAQVKKGQVIADLGMINRQSFGVHFEIRRLGKPVNPLSYLNKA